MDLAELCQTVQEELPSMLLTLLHEIERKALPLTSLYTDSVTSLSKLDQDTIRKIYRPVFLMNLDRNKHNKTVANQSHHQIRKVVHHDRVVFIPGMQG